TWRYGKSNAYTSTQSVVRDLDDVDTHMGLPAVNPCAGFVTPVESRRCWFFLGLVVTARAKHPIPSRTRQLSAAAPMVLRLKTWESRSLPNLERTNTVISLSMRP